MGIFLYRKYYKRKYCIMKRILLLSVLLQTVICVSASDFEVNSIHYNITRKAAPYTVEVTSAWPKSYKYSGEVVIPETVTYDGITYEVTAIGMGAFSGSKDLTSVVIPNTVVQPPSPFRSIGI